MIDSCDLPFGLECEERLGSEPFLGDEVDPPCAASPLEGFLGSRGAADFTEAKLREEVAGSVLGALRFFIFAEVES